MIMDSYRNIGISILEDKVKVMRALSGQYKKQEMSHVYSVIFKNEVD